MPKSDQDVICAASASEVGPDEWVHLMPAGQWQARDGRGPFSLKDAAAVVSRSMSAGMDLPIDRDHIGDLAPRGTLNPAMGWLTAMEARPDGVWGRVEWTPGGRQLLDAREYRYLSPVFKASKAGEIHSILGAGLTNTPAFPLRSVANQETTNMDLETELRRVMGLADDVDAAGIIAAVQQTAESASAKPDPARFVPIEQYQEVALQLATIQAAATQAEVEREIASSISSGKLSPAQKEWATEYALADLAGFKRFVAAAPVIVAAGQLHPRKVPSSDPLRIAELATVYRNEQERAGRHISTTDAVNHVMAGVQA